jgi:hypothetical protein
VSGIIVISLWLNITDAEKPPKAKVLWRLRANAEARVNPAVIACEMAIYVMIEPIYTSDSEMSTINLSNPREIVIGPFLGNDGTVKKREGEFRHRVLFVGL